jgi:hypothetical protein
LVVRRRAAEEPIVERSEQEPAEAQRRTATNQLVPWSLPPVVPIPPTTGTGAVVGGGTVVVSVV